MARRKGAKAPSVLLKDEINFAKLDASLSTAVAADAKYHLENDAKIRAVNQKVGSYQEFEQIVKGAHLKPLEEDITQLQLGRSAWAATGRSRGRERRKQAARGQQLAAQEGYTAPTEAPASASMFQREWRRCPSCADKHRYLFIAGAATIGKIFSAEMSLLGDFVTVLAQGFTPEHAAATLALLEVFPDSGRFDLTLQLLSDAELEAISSLWEKLRAALAPEQHERIHTAAERYAL